MNYMKPELTKLAGAMASIQNRLDKSEQEAPDADLSNPNPASALAYDADE